MSIKSYLISSFDIGQKNDIEPWLLPEQAFESLEDAYVWRGRVKKRWGYSLIGGTDLNSRLRIDLGNTDANGDFSGTVPGNVFQVGQSFSVGSDIFTVSVTGSAPPGTMLSTGAGSGTYNTTTGAVVITGASATTAVYFYPSLPVMGIITRERPEINFETVIAFDTRFSYIRSGGAWERLDTNATTGVWSGSNSQFFWGINYRGANPYETLLYVVNFNRADRIRYIAPSGSSPPSTQWTILRPQLDAGGSPTRFLDSCRILIGYKDRLVALNTLETENATTSADQRVFPNRARFSQNGDPRAAATSWLDTTRGRGGYIDAPTQEQIVTAYIIKDRLIVYFERSTWELVYTGFPYAPFRWQKINSELGCESTFSVVGFDSLIVGVGNIGVHASDGVTVQRIDQNIPNEVYKIHNASSGPQRVHGIRDFVPELVYWTFPSAINEPIFPNRVLIYNYQNKTWAFFKDSFTCFGYFQKDTSLTWATVGNKYPTWSAWNEPWNSGRSQSAFPDVVAGTQQGFVVTINVDDSSNDQTLYITNMTSATSNLNVIDHNLEVSDYILIEDAVGITFTDPLPAVTTIYRVKTVTDSNNIIIDATFTGTYTGGGKITRISGVNILTKQFNPGTPVGQEFSFPYIDLLLNTTVDGQFSIDYFVDSDEGASIQDNVLPDVLLGSNIVTTEPENLFGSGISNTYIWHRYFLQTNAKFLQFKFYLSDDQLKDSDIVNSNFVLQAMIIYAKPEGRIIG